MEVVRVRVRVTVTVTRVRVRVRVVYLLRVVGCGDGGVGSVLSGAFLVPAQVHVCRTPAQSSGVEAGSV